MAWYDRAQNTIVSGGQGAAIGYTVGGPWGAVAGGAFGALAGLISPTEQIELARRYAAGEVPPEVERQIVRQLAKRYNMLRGDTGADLARRGVFESTGGARMMADISQQEREALANALAGQTFNYQKLGMDLIAQRNQALQSGIGAAASVLGHKKMLDYYRQRDKDWQDFYRNQSTGTMPVVPPPANDTPIPTAPPAQGVTPIPTMPQGSDNPHIGRRSGIKAPGALSALSGVNSNFSRRQPIAAWG